VQLDAVAHRDVLAELAGADDGAPPPAAGVDQHVGACRLGAVLAQQDVVVRPLLDDLQVLEPGQVQPSASTTSAVAAKPLVPMRPRRPP